MVPSEVKGTAMSLAWTSPLYRRGTHAPMFTQSQEAPWFLRCLTHTRVSLPVNLKWRVRRSGSCKNECFMPCVLSCTPHHFLEKRMGVTRGATMGLKGQKSVRYIRYDHETCGAGGNRRGRVAFFLFNSLEVIPLAVNRDGQPHKE